MASLNKRSTENRIKAKCEMKRYFTEDGHGAGSN